DRLVYSSNNCITSSLPPFVERRIGLSSNARVQRGPSEAARCASTEGSPNATLISPVSSWTRSSSRPALRSDHSLRFLLARQRLASAPGLAVLLVAALGSTRYAGDKRSVVREVHHEAAAATRLGRTGPDGQRLHAIRRQRDDLPAFSPRSRDSRRGQATVGAASVHDIHSVI